MIREVRACLVAAGLAALVVSGTSAASDDRPAVPDGSSVASEPSAADPFVAPPRLEPRIAFWVSIYTRYTTRQAVVHDADLPEVVYGVVDLGGSGGSRANLEIEREIIRLAREKVQAILLRLQASRGVVAGLSDEERLVHDALDSVAGDDRFRRAAERVRVQRGQSDRFRAGLIRSGRYLDAFREIARSEGVPEDLAFLPHVESSFEIGARSHVGAAGMWQFMRDTGRRFLTINWTRDDRYDPWEAARGAFRLLRENYEVLGSWPLALTAYNHGQGGMLKARETFGDDLVAIIDKYDGRSFGFASRSFYAEFLAARRIARDPEPWFGPIQPEEPLQFAPVEVAAAMSAVAVGRRYDVDAETLRLLNPSLHPDIWSGRRHIPVGTSLRVPSAQTRLALAEAQPAGAQQGGAQAASLVPAAPEWYGVRSGDTLFSIARRHGTTVDRLRALNGIGAREAIRPGQRLRLVPDRSAATISESGGATAAEIIRHVVRQGETLAEIALRYGIAISRVAMANRLEDASRIKAGQVLLIPASR